MVNNYTLKNITWEEEAPEGFSNPMVITEDVIYEKNTGELIEIEEGLFNIILHSFFRQYPNAEIDIKITANNGYTFSKNYQYFFYNKLYKFLFPEDDFTDIFDSDMQINETVFLRQELTYVDLKTIERILKIIEKLDINLSKESNNLHIVLFSKREKKNIKISNNILAS